MANTLSRAILCAALLALPVSAQPVGVVDERSLEWDDSGVVVRASGDLVVGDVTVGRFVLKLPRSDEPVYFLPGGVGAELLAREDEDDLDDGDDGDEDDDDERGDEEAVIAAARAFAEAVVGLGSEDRFGPGPCDRETPEHCLEVRKLLDRVVTPLGGGVPRRWLWEAGALFRVQSTVGDLLGQFRGGVVYASEPFLHSNGEVRVTLIPVPEPASGSGLVAGLAAALAAARWWRDAAPRDRPRGWRTPRRCPTLLAAAASAADGGDPP